MKISIILAMDEERGIGRENAIPWHLSTDLKRFKALTMGHHMIMGRKTYESIGRPLPGRTTIVITRQQDYLPDGCLVTHSLEEALRLAEANGENEVFIIGGGQVFAQALPMADQIYLTEVHTRAVCDVFFPPFKPEDWTESEVAAHPADEKNQHAVTFKTLLRKQGAAE